MIETIYIERNVLDHPRTRKICERFPDARKIYCDRYTEIFNPKAQNFRLQKHKPSLILAEKFKNLVLPAPLGYGIGSQNNYYFSHMLNCLYDCRYCFLQGMYQSAHYVLFVNYDDFHNKIREIAARKSCIQPHFFSGYDCDSLAMDPITGFSESFLDLFSEIPQALLEIRTKSTQVRSLLNREPIANCVIAFSFTPEPVSRALEHKVPSIERRINALSKLSAHGWPIGLRFDPMIYEDNYQPNYQELFGRIFSVVKESTIHSVSLGSFRLPGSFFRKIKRLYPREKMFAGPLELKGNQVSYKPVLETEMSLFCSEALMSHVPQHKIFHCNS